MKISKDATRDARRIFRLCSKSGQLDEVKLRTAIAQIVKRKPRAYKEILHALKRLIRLEQESRSALVVSATELDASSRAKIETNLIKKYGKDLIFDYQVDPALLGGIRIRVGNDVWDGSVRARINRLQEAF